MDFRSKPECWNGGGRHRVDNAPAVDQNLDDGVGDLIEGRKDGSAERVVGSWLPGRCQEGIPGSSIQRSGEGDSALLGRQRADFFDDAPHKAGESFEAGRELGIDFVDLCNWVSDVGRRRVLVILNLDEKSSRAACGLPLRRTLEMSPSLTLEASNSRICIRRLRGGWSWLHSPWVPPISWSFKKEGACNCSSVWLETC